jgi:hypothetical protein
MQTLLLLLTRSLLHQYISGILPIAPTLATPPSLSYKSLPGSINSFLYYLLSRFLARLDQELQGERVEEEEETASKEGAAAKHWQPYAPILRGKR